MNGKVELFDFNGRQVRTVLIDNDPYFVGKDVAEILGYKNTKDTLSKHVDSEEKRGVANRDPRSNRLVPVTKEAWLSATD